MALQYFSEALLDYSGNARTLPILARHRISKDVAKAMLADGRIYVVVEFGDTNKVTMVTPPDMDFGPFYSAELTRDAATLSPLTTPPVRPAFWREKPHGSSRFGGPPPEGFRMPEAGFHSGYQFIGLIGREEALPVPLTGDMPLLYPMFGVHPACFWDVSDPGAPRLFDPDTCFMMNLGDPNQPYPIVSDHLSGPSEADEIAEVFAGGGLVEYAEARVGRVEADLPSPEFRYLGVASLPEWVQQPEIPICPRTGEPMHLLGELFPGLPIVRNDVADVARTVLDEYNWDWYFGSGLMPWGGNWSIFVHYHPVGKSVCLHPQAT